MSQPSDSRPGERLAIVAEVGAELDRLFHEAEEREAARRGRGALRRGLSVRRWRPLALIMVLVLGGATGALAAAGVFQAGAPLGPGAPVAATAGNGAATGARLMPLRVADPKRRPSVGREDHPHHASGNVHPGRARRLWNGRCARPGRRVLKRRPLSPALEELRAGVWVRDRGHQRQRVPHARAERPPLQRPTDRLPPGRHDAPTSPASDSAQGVRTRAGVSAWRTAQRLLRAGGSRCSEHHLRDPDRTAAHRAHRGIRRRLPDRAALRSPQARRAARTGRSARQRSPSTAWRHRRRCTPRCTTATARPAASHSPAPPRPDPASSIPARPSATKLGQRQQSARRRSSPRSRCAARALPVLPRRRATRLSRAARSHRAASASVGASRPRCWRA